MDHQGTLTDEKGRRTDYSIMGRDPDPDKLTRITIGGRMGDAIYLTYRGSLEEAKELVRHFDDLLGALEEKYDA